MTLCFVSDYYPTMPHFGGIAVYTRRIALALAARGHEVHIVVAKAGQSSDWQDEGVHVHFRQVRWIPVFGRLLQGLGESIGIARILAGLNRLHRFDAVEIPNWEGLGLASTCVPGLPVITRLHTSVAESVEMAGRRPDLPERFMIWAEKTSSRRSRAVVTHSDSHCRRMARASGLDAITVIPHGIALPPEAPPAPEKVVLSIGGMSPRKGMRYLFGAIPAILDRVPEARFKIVGVDVRLAAVQAFQSQHKEAAQRIQFLGSVSGETLSSLYAECALFVSPSLYESFGLTFLEAMSHGRPVVGCATSAIPEIVDHGVTGLLVKPRSETALAGAITQLLLDDDARASMGAAARRVAMERFSLDLVAERTERFFLGLSAL